MTPHTGPQAQEAGEFVLVRRDLLAKVLVNLDPPPVEIDGQTKIFVNPMAARVLQIISADVRSMVDKSKQATPARVVSDADVEQRARDLFAAEYERDGIEFMPGEIRKPNSMLTMFEDRAIRAIKAALSLPTGDAAEGKDGDDLYYIQDTRQYVGNCVTWWGTERRGYVTRLDLAGKYTKDEAFRQAASRGSDKAWPCAVIDKLIRPTIDMQELPEDTALQPGQGNSNG